MAHIFRLALLFLLATTLESSAQERVVALGGRVSVELPADWAYAEKGRDATVGPKGVPFIHLGYFEGEFQDLPDPVTHADVAEFVQNNLKIAKSEDLDGGRVFGHAVEKKSGMEDHQWNIAKVVDARHIAVLLLGMEIGLDHARIVSMVDRLARSVRFIPHKRKT